MSASIANSFFWKWDKKQSDKCDLAVGFIKTAQQVIQIAFLMGIPEIGLITAVPANEAAAAEAATAEAGALASAAEAQTPKGMVAWMGTQYRNGVIRWDKFWRSGTVGKPGKDLAKLKQRQPWHWRNHVPYKAAKFWNHLVQPPIWQTIPVVALGAPMNVSHCSRTAK